jgi:hypothetical protein
MTEEPPMGPVEQVGTAHRERLERFRRHAQRVRETEVSRIAIDILGVPPDDVARALRGNLTEDDEDDAAGEGGATRGRRAGR